MKKIILYTTKYGSVEKAASMLKNMLGDDTVMVNLMKEKAPGLGEFTTVILGGSIYVGKVQKELSEYISKNLPELLKKRVGLFICAAQEPEVIKQELENAFPAELYQQAIAKEHLGYEFDFKKMSFMDKTITKMIAKTKESRFEISQAAITEFAKRMAE